MVDVAHHSATYPQTLQLWWERGEDFVNVEHDVVVPVGALLDFDLCPEPWCWHAYAGHSLPWPYPMLGLVRFRSEVMEKCPDLWEVYLARGRDPGLNPDTLQPMPATEVVDPTGLPLWNGEPQWVHCDEWSAAYLRLHGFTDHRHFPDVENL